MIWKTALEKGLNEVRQTFICFPGQNELLLFCLSCSQQDAVKDKDVM